jgi:hypothetical protein
MHTLTTGALHCYYKLVTLIGTLIGISSVDVIVSTTTHNHSCTIPLAGPSHTAQAQTWPDHSHSLPQLTHSTDNMTSTAAIFASDSVLDPAGELSTTAVSPEPAYIPPLS